MAAAIASLIVLPAALVSLASIDGTVDEGEVGVSFTGVPWTISAAITPIPSPELGVYVLPTGEELTTPVANDQCWTAFPLCRPYPNDLLAFRGSSVQDGFASLEWDQ